MCLIGQWPHVSLAVGSPNGPTGVLLRDQPELIPDAVEELLRLDGPFICIGRTARHDTEVGGKSIKAGERIINLMGIGEPR